MFRDNYKDENYFKNFIEKKEKLIKNSKAVRDSDPKDSQKYRRCNISLSLDYLDYLKAKCSVGASYKELKKIAEEYIKLIEEGSAGSLYYDKVVEALSMIIVYDINTPKLDLLLGYTEKEDRILDGIKNYIKNGIFESKLTNTWPGYQEFDKYVSGITNLEDFEKFMEKRWYSTCRGCAWYNTHKNQNDVYAGYWCWLAAAVIKIRGEKLDHDIKYVPSIPIKSNKKIDLKSIIKKYLVNKK